MIAILRDLILFFAAGMPLARRVFDQIEKHPRPDISRKHLKTTRSTEATADTDIIATMTKTIIHTTA
jgi:hypothetical protein